MYTSGIILATGATGGVGKRVVNILERKGLRVRALFRNEEKARRLLGPDVDLVKSVVPFSEPYTVDPENPPAAKDYNVYLLNLKGGITGKESLEQTPVPV